MLRVLNASLAVAITVFLCACSNTEQTIAGQENAPVHMIQDGKDPAFIFFGDFGTGTKDQFRVANVMVDFCKSHRCDFLLTLGDNIYPSGVESISDPRLPERIDLPYGRIGKKMFAVLGNHDYSGNPMLQVEYNALSKVWTLPSSYYSFEQDNAIFFGIDTNDFSEQQAEWLSKGLKSSASHWKIVFGHHPVVSYGHHGPKEDVAALLLPMLDKGADFYLAGHEHDKQIIDRGKTHPMYIISGAAAKARPSQAGQDSLYASSTLGFGYMVLHGDEAEISFIDEHGQVEFETILKKR